MTEENKIREKEQDKGRDKGYEKEKRNQHRSVGCTTTSVNFGSQEQV